ncbi:unnamed protein product [Thlaspi arvense]|uniref:poly(ADP-ribose) glycohydrolase n=1 Tax=Thlaspi arvense TaxID=13288 RepID=A0AAU9SBC3_THLAR|nr:unnamed protein product [Thlaspi arvense]
MENREDLNSILPYLPLVIRSSSLYWPPRVVEALKAMSEGPSHSRVDSGEVLWQAISDMRRSLSLSTSLLAPSASQGYAFLFDELIREKESKTWFDEIIPAMAGLLLRFPSLLEVHFQNADDVVSGIKTGLRLLDPQQAGIVFLSQELIGALLACAFFCLFPVDNRGAKDLPVINFDNLFATLYESYSESHESKIRCIMHYFERVCSCLPTGTVSFERKILPPESHSSSITAPEADFWSKSDVALCAFKVHSSGLIEDQPHNALEVDFANKYLGGGALNRGCVQEEIRFMINPELIAGMLFLPRMDDNEAIEIVGAERFSCYTGEINKALCGFLNHRKSWQHQNISIDKGDNEIQVDKESGLLHTDTTMSHRAPLNDVETNREKHASNFDRDFYVEGADCMDHEDDGVATGNWGCGVFGGDPELKAMIQWLAASQARRPFISYYTFGVKALENIDQNLTFTKSSICSKRNRVSGALKLRKAIRMEKRADVRSFLQYLPLVAQSSSLVWPPSVEQELQTMSRGPNKSMVNSGVALASHIMNMRKSLSLDASDLAPNPLRGYAIFFDKKISREESAKFFGEVVPALCGLLIKLPSLLETHYQKADHVLGGATSRLRLLGPQEAGIVFLSQELIAALLACSFFCLFPEVNRRLKHLQRINFDDLFSFPYMGHCTKQENKIRCLIHYFERICRCMPTGFVSFERKVLPQHYNPHYVSCPEVDYWATSSTPLCTVEIHTSGAIEDQTGEALEVDFADEYFGGLTLSYDTLQEEIRFVINPELIAGMIFLPRMDANEAIEIVGVERFSRYTGYGPSFQYAGDYTDKKDLDALRRRKTRVIAIDAIPNPGSTQYKPDALLREVNKAFSGYLHQCKYQIDGPETKYTHPEASSSVRISSATARQVVESSQRLCIDHEEKIGVATGNWGCGVFGGDPELKIMLQWLAISQARRPFMSYYTFGLQALRNVNQVMEKVASQKLTVGDLWSKLVEYSSERLSRRTRLGFFSWLT